jgi:hypothetical protein
MNIKLLLLASLVFLLNAPFSNCSDYYVDSVSGSNNNSGVSPELAFKTITCALIRVKGYETDPVCIHVAKGTYNKDLGETFPIQMRSYVALEGFDENTTIIDATGSKESVISCSDHYTDLYDVNLKKLTITGGKASSVFGGDHGGGGIICENAEVRISDCIVDNNTAIPGKGGGIYYSSFGAYVEIVDSRISNNSANMGGGAYSDVMMSGIVLVNTTIENNSAIYNGDDDSGKGGGICGGADLFNCKVINNTAFLGGGISCGIYTRSNYIDIHDSKINGNKAIKVGLKGGEGGGIYMWIEGSISVLNSELSGNEAEGSGGAIHCHYTDSKVIGCDIFNNTASLGGGITYTYMSADLFSNNIPSSIQDCHIHDNSVKGGNGGGIILIMAEPKISGCTIEGNQAQIDNGVGGYGGGIDVQGDYDDSCFPWIVNCLVINNAAVKGGGVCCREWGFPHLNNLTIIGNTAQEGAGIANIPAPLKYGQAYMTNCIVWDNDISGKADVSFSDIENGYAGYGNINTNPMFIKGAWGDYYLSQENAGQMFTSPCVDRGTEVDELARFDNTWLTTRSDGAFDTNTIDMGFHYPPNVIFDLKITSLNFLFYPGDRAEILVNLKTSPKGLGENVDIYFVMINPRGSVYSGMGWDLGLKPLMRNVFFPADLSINDVLLFDKTMPCDKPPIPFNHDQTGQGSYKFAIGAVKSGTGEFVSNIDTVEVYISYDFWDKGE